MKAAGLAGDSHTAPGAVPVPQTPPTSPLGGGDVLTPFETGEEQKTGLPEATQLEVEPGRLTPSPSRQGEGGVGEGLHSAVPSSCVYVEGQRFSGTVLSTCHC